MANLLDLDLELVRGLTLDGKKVLRLKYGDLILWDGTNILIRVNGTESWGNSALCSSSLIFPDDTAITAAVEALEAEEEALAKRIQLDNTAVEVLCVYNVDEQIRGSMMTLEDLITEASQGIKTSTSAIGSLEPMPNTFELPDDIDISVEKESSGARISVAQAVPESTTETVGVQRESSGALSKLISAVPQSSDAFVEVLRDSSAQKILVITVPDLNVTETVAVLASSSAIKIQLHDVTLIDEMAVKMQGAALALVTSGDKTPAVVDTTPMYTQTEVQVSQVYTDEVSMQTGTTSFTDTTDSIISVVYSDDVPVQASASLGALISDKVLLIYSDDTPIEVSAFMQTDASVITQISLVDWEYPVLMDNALHITQVYSGTVTGNVLKLE